MDWRSATWARWLGWTAVFGLVVGGSAFVGRTLYARFGELPALLSALLIAPSLVAPVLIGIRFPSLWWGLGPPAMILALGAVLFLPDPNADLILGWVIAPLIIVSIVLGALSLVGV